MHANKVILYEKCKVPVFNWASCHEDTYERGDKAPRILKLGRLQVQATLTPQKRISCKFILYSGLFVPQNPSGYGAEEKKSLPSCELSPSSLVVVPTAL